MQESLAQQAYHRLRARLRSGELPPGSQLVNRTLAAELGCSFTPVREAISRLALEGLVEHVPGVGAYVRKPDRQELAQLYDVRSILEPFAAFEAARHVTDDEIDQLRNLCEDLAAIAMEIRTREHGRASHEQMERWLAAEECFHELIIRAARNPWLIKMAVELQVLSLVFTAQVTEEALLTAEVADSTRREHSRLVELLEERDSGAARDWMSSHILNGRSYVLSHFLGRRG